MRQHQPLRPAEQLNAACAPLIFLIPVLLACGVIVAMPGLTLFFLRGQ